MFIYSVNGVLSVINSPITINKIIQPVTYFFSAQRFEQSASATVTDGVQQVEIQILNRGYSPNYVKVQRGMPVQLTLQSNGVYSCALSFVFKEFGINTFLESTDLQSFTFTPNKPGKYAFTCSMGMYTGTMEVI